MSSDDDFYDFQDHLYERRRPYRPRRRGSAQSHRHRRFSDPYRGRKSRRTKTWYFQNTPRVIAVLIFLFLLGYEFFILKGPLSSTHSTRRMNSLSRNSTIPISAKQSVSSSGSTAVDNKPLKPSAPTTEKEIDIPSKKIKEIPKPQAPISVDSGTTVAERVKAASKPTYSKPSSDSPPYRPLRKHRRTSDSTESVKLLQDKKPRPASALALETRPADEEADAGPEDPDVSNKKVSSKRKKKTNSSSQENIIIKQPSDSDVDRSPSSSSNSVKHGEGGAEPGAGENFWQWFQETKGSEKGSVSGSITCPEENKRLCQMTYKYLRKYKIRSIFDASCEKNSDWMPEVLRKAGNELWGFKYYCSVPNDEKIDYVKEKYGSLNFVDYIPDLWWRDGFPDDTELLFAWDTLPHIAYGRVWNFFVKAKKQDIKYILVDNYPGIMNDPSPKRNYLNLRKHPFRFPAAKEVVQNVTEPGEEAKRQLLFYEGNMLPDNLQ